MKTYIFYSSLFIFFLSVISTPVPSSARHGVNSAVKAPVPVSTMVMMPFVIGKDAPRIDDSMNRTLICPLDNLCLGNDDEVPEYAAEKLTEIVHGNLKSRIGPKLVPLNSTRTEFENLPIDGKTDTPRSIGRKLGRVFNADHIVIGSIWRYDERLGGALAAEQPASVAFVIYLVEVESGKELWKGYFDKTQQSLTDNLFKFSEFFKQGGKWLSAEQLSRFGVKALMEKFPPVN